MRLGWLDFACGKDPAGYVQNVGGLAWRESGLARLERPEGFANFDELDASSVRWGRVLVFFAGYMQPQHDA